MIGSARMVAVRVAALALLIVATLAAPGAVNGAGSAKPDGWIQVRAICDDTSCSPFVKAWKGKNVYNSTGNNQTSKITYTGTSIGYGTVYLFAINIENDGTASGRFKVQAPSSSWSIKYFRGSTNITSAVVAGTYQTSSLAPGASYEITARADLDSVAGAGTRLITITSSTDSTRKDAVKLRLKHVACGC